jgi:hypothetical protein
MANQGTTVQELDGPECLRHQQREWITERVGWCMIVVILAVAVLGGLGPGALGPREYANDDGSLRVKAHAVERYEAPSMIEVWVQPTKPQRKDAELTFSREFADETTVEQVVPEPDRLAVREGRLRLTFTRSDLLTHGGKIVYRYKHDSYGPRVFDVSLVEGESVTVHQFVMP